MTQLDSCSEKKHCCCISHQFFNAASQNPNKVSVIHASGGARICRGLHEKIIEEEPDFNDTDQDAFFDLNRVSPSDPAFKDDLVFTYSEISDSVAALSYRIRRVLDGGEEDTSLIRPKGYVHEEFRVDNKATKLPNIVNLTHKHTSDLQNMESTPQILGIYMVPSIEYIVAVLAVLRCGEAFLPLDPSWPKKRILSILASSKVRLIISCKSSSDTTVGHWLDKSDWLTDQSSCPVLYMCMKEKLNEHLRCFDLVWPCEIKNTRKFCYLMYTSGSSGTPKGVCGTERGLLNRYLWMQELFPLHGGEILLFKTSISFIDHLQEFLNAILTCVPLVIPPFQQLKANPLFIVDFLKAYRISRLIIVPSVMKALLPAMCSRYNMRVQRSLQVLVFSGEVLPVSLWEVLHNLFPETTILNLYGSTEVSGDCTYFNCKRLPKILENTVLSSVPIGMPIANCNIVVGEPNQSKEGEIYVGGLCTSMGYFLDPMLTSVGFVKISDVSGICDAPPLLDMETELYFRTGDIARRLQTGDLVFLGRKDRTLKVTGQRVTLEEIENILREHPDVDDAAVISARDHGGPACIGAYIVLKRKEEFYDMLDSSIRVWLVERLPPALIPSYYSCLESLPLSSTGKVDYALLLESSHSLKQIEEVEGITDAAHIDPDFLKAIKEVFADVLKIEKVVNNDDFFAMGGDSIAAAQVAHRLGINMRLLYIFPSPSKLLNALLDNEVSYKYDFTISSDWEVKLKSQNGNNLRRRSFPSRNDYPVNCKYVKVGSELYTSWGSTTMGERIPQIASFSSSTRCSFSRCNKVVYGGKDDVNDVRQACWSVKTPRNIKGSMRELWKVHLNSCVDASPLVILKDGCSYLCIGSHSQTFVCVDGVSGFLRWDVQLEGRIECSAAILDDFSQVVVGCYKGKIYFVDFTTGSILWVFHSGGEVKSQPVVDERRNLIWCGSYDHHIYALDYKNHCCVYNVSCGGSIYGSPSIDMVHNMLYVASTKGRVTAISIEALPFIIMWVYELGSPVFGSLTSANGNVICCMVDGHVVVLSLSGSIIWKAITGGPVFAGACISHSLPSQVLVCSRDGSIYSFDLGGGDLLWQYNVGYPIISSAYVDDNMQLISDTTSLSDRLICICSSPGSIYLLRVNLHAMTETVQLSKEIFDPVVQEFARIDLPGDIFSSPVMIGGRIFVGCRDDYVHCIGVEAKIAV